MHTLRTVGKFIIKITIQVKRVKNSTGSCCGKAEKDNWSKLVEQIIPGDGQHLRQIYCGTISSEVNRHTHAAGEMTFLNAD
jgi:hypothetical protein